MTFSSPRLFAFILTTLGAYCFLYYDFLVELLSHTQPFGQAPTVPLSGRYQPKIKRAPTGKPDTFRRRIVAIGDLHGDYENAIRVLKMSGVINDKEEWSGNVDYFVQAGDVFDRGPDSRKLFEYLENLRRQATKQHGVMVSILGNHEYLNALGDWSHVTDQDITNFGGLEERKNRILNAEGDIAQSLRKNYKCAARLPLHPSIGKLNEPYSSAFPSESLHYEVKDDGKDKDKDQNKDEAEFKGDSDFSHAALSIVHGGLFMSDQHFSLSSFPATINEITSNLWDTLTEKHRNKPYSQDNQIRHKYERELDENNEEALGEEGMNEEEKKAHQRWLYSPTGPLWNRVWPKWRYGLKQLCDTAINVLNKTGTRRMIMGHTIGKKGILSACEGKLIFIDTAISRYMESDSPNNKDELPDPQRRLSALVIDYTLTPTDNALTGTKQRWQEEEVVKALYLEDPEKPDSKIEKPLHTASRTIVGDFTVPDSAKNE